MKKNPESIWIVKPPGEMCGNGIRLVTDPKDVLDSRWKWNKSEHLCIKGVFIGWFMSNGEIPVMRTFSIPANV